MIVIVKDLINDSERAFSGSEDQVEEGLRSAFPGVALTVEFGDLDHLIWCLGMTHGKIVEVPEGHIAKPELHLPIRFDDEPHDCGRMCLGLSKAEPETPLSEQIDGWLLEKAIADIKPGEDTNKEVALGKDEIPSKVYNYNHVVPAHLQHKYQIQVHERPKGANYVPGGTFLEAFLVKHPFNFVYDDVGKVSGMVMPKNKETKHLNIDLAEIQDADHRGKGLGMALYEAVMAHAKHYHGTTHVSGGQHSSMSHNAHLALSRRHGMNYSARYRGEDDGLWSESDPRLDANHKDFLHPHDFHPSPKAFDESYGRYTYAIKNDTAVWLIKVERGAFKGSGFRLKSTGEVCFTGAWHNIYECPENWKVDEDHVDHIEAGFLYHNDKFYTRAEAAAHIASPKKENLQSEDLQGLGRKPGEETLGGGIGLVKSFRMEDQTHSSNGEEYRVPDLVNYANTNKKVQQVPLGSFTHSKGDEEYGSPAFHARAMQADLKYPIIAVQHPDGLYVADGMHRLYRHQLNGATHAPALVLDHTELANIKPTPKVVNGRLIKMAIEDIPPGIEKRGQKKFGLPRYSKFHDYQHVLSPLQKRHYFLTIRERAPGGGPLERGQFDVRLHSRRLRDYRGWPLEVGYANARIRDFDGSAHGAPNPEHGFRAVSVDDVRVHQRYRNKGLGLAIYEAAFAHAKHNHKATHVMGSTHSSAASAVHQKLSAKHGMEYHPVRNENWGDQEPSGKDYDAGFGPYSYALKSEQLQKMALADIKPGTLSSSVFEDGRNIYDYSHILHPDLRNKYEIEVHNVDHSDAYSAESGNPYESDPYANDVYAHLFHTFGPHRNLVGTVSGTVHPDDGLRIWESNVDSFHRGKGLGTHLYEAMMAHAFHAHGIRTVRGDSHSSMAGSSHRKLSQKHGFEGYSHQNLINRPKEPYDEAHGRYKYTLKSEGDDSWLALADNLSTSVNEDSELVEDMSGFAPRVHTAFEAARFLVNGRESLSLDQIRRALWLEDGDFERAALRAYNIEPDEKHLGALRAIMKIGFLTKTENTTPQRVECPISFSANTCSEVQRGVSSGMVQHVNLNGKYSKGSMVVRDPKSQHVYLLKPDSEGISPAAGISEQAEINQPRREAAFWQIANILGLGGMIPRADLIELDGEEWAAIRLLPYNFKNLEKRWKADRGSVMGILERYRAAGTLHKWGALDYILGNPDRHGQNLMIGHGEKTAPVDRDISLIDHGSAFAGYGFAPANDSNSFIPFYLRAWVTTPTFNKLRPDEKLRQMPTTNHDVNEMLKRWLADISEDRIKQIVEKYGIDPGPVLFRLSKLRALPDSPDVAIDKLWAGGA